MCGSTPLIGLVVVILIAQQLDTRVGNLMGLETVSDGQEYSHKMRSRKIATRRTQVLPEARGVFYQRLTM